MARYQISKYNFDQIRFITITLNSIDRYFECSQYDGEDPLCSFGEESRTSYDYHLNYFDRNILDRGNACNSDNYEDDL